MTDEMKEVLKAIKESYKKGHNDAVEKACAFIDSHLDWVRTDIAYTNKEFIKDFKQDMKEQS